jgi:hypothetical protein
VQRPAEGILGHALLGGDLQDLPEQGDRPARVRVAEIPGRDGEQGLQQVLLILVQRRAAPPASGILEGSGVVVLRVGLDPIIDTLPGHAEHPGDVSGRTTPVEFQDGECPPIQAGIVGLRELTPEAPPLPRREVEPAHKSLPR